MLTKVNIATILGLELLACHCDVAACAGVKDGWAIDGTCRYRPNSLVTRAQVMSIEQYLIRWLEVWCQLHYSGNAHQ